MSEPIESYRKVQYEFRPAKQVERRMMLETFQCLNHLGYPIREYQYLGMGSIYFVDYILFHKYLGLTKMKSYEKNEKDEGRIKFNQPFKCVDIMIGDINDSFSSMDESAKYLLWLDYDDIIDMNIAESVRHAVSILQIGRAHV